MAVPLNHPQMLVAVDPLYFLLRAGKNQPGQSA